MDYVGQGQGHYELTKQRTAWPRTNNPPVVLPTPREACRQIPEQAVDHSFLGRFMNAVGRFRKNWSVCHRYLFDKGAGARLEVTR